MGHSRIFYSPSVYFYKILIGGKDRKNMTILKIGYRYINLFAVCWFPVFCKYLVDVLISFHHGRPYSRHPVLVVMSGSSCTGGRVLAVLSLSWLSFPGCLFIMIPPQLFCPANFVLTPFSGQSCLGSPVRAVLSCLLWLRYDIFSGNGHAAVHYYVQNTIYPLKSTTFI
jgi:hypothetical protein